MKLPLSDIHMRYIQVEDALLTFMQWVLSMFLSKVRLPTRRRLSTKISCLVSTRPDGERPPLLFILKTGIFTRFIIPGPFIH